VSEQALLRLRSGSGVAPGHLLARDPEGVLAGYAQLDAPRDEHRAVGPDAVPGAGITGDVRAGVAELAVHPAQRRRGVGTRLITALLDEVARPVSAAGGRLRVWAHGAHPGAVALAETFGFRQVRALWQMRRSLREPLPTVRLPEGVRLRSFRVGQDEQAVVEVNNRAFAWHPEQGNWDVRQVAVREAEPWFDPDGFLLAVDDTGRLLGFHWTKVHAATGQHEPIGEVYVVGVDPGAQGRRLGTALTVAGLAYLRDRGLDQAMLYVEADNAGAISVYERLGFTHWDTDVAYLH
jgi:mycothiol synthase